MYMLAIIPVARCYNDLNDNGGHSVGNVVITLDAQEVDRLEQVLMDRDIEGAWQLLAEIRIRVRRQKDIHCGIEKLRRW
ncbi:MAG TPA: hypothetical protein DCX22_02095 [Dehalococcoidia bacterium]|nr:hypothetical protein [Dehalococcoidia bacterium]